MILFENEYEWKREDSKTDVRFCFDCPEEAAELRVTFSFEPDALRDEEACAPMITEAIEKYYEGREKRTEGTDLSSAEADPGQEAGKADASGDRRDRGPDREAGGDAFQPLIENR